MQRAIDEVPLGSVLELDAGAVFFGSFNLPKKDGEGWIILISSLATKLPEEENRIIPDQPTGILQFPTQKDLLSKIVTTNLSGLPCFRTSASAHHYRFTGLEITVAQNVINSYGLMFLGSGTQSTPESVPHHIIVDRCYIHGHSDATVMKAGILLNSSYSAIVDSHISEFHSIGFDTYAIGGTNGPGPFKILNNYLEAAGENILFGGASASIPGLVPSDIEIRNNHFYKPFSWRVGHSDYKGKHWTIKNLFELKTGKRVWLDGNVFENVWSDLPVGQSGYAILFTVRTEGGGSPQADVSDITCTNNIIRKAGAGISISGRDNPGSNQSQRIYFANNLFYEIDGDLYGDGNIAGPNDGTFLKIGEPSDVIFDHNTVLQSGPVTWAYDTTRNCRFTNNLFLSFLSAGGYQGMYGPGFAHGGNGPMARYFPDITDANKNFDRNILVKAPSNRYSNYSTISQNYFPAGISDVGFTDFTGGMLDIKNFMLSASSPYQTSSIDGKAIGVNFDELLDAQKVKKRCETKVSVKDTNSSHNHFEMYPNPANSEVHFMLKNTEFPSKISVRDITGKTWCHKTFPSSEKLELSVTGMPRGFYMVLLIQNGRVIDSQKLVIE
ncbi:MAG: T9SS type A sorting domain-containing protein [Saprospiraceae bacterium]|nr:T9SS type A sorting domain-containing protein [Saprospiraceae bacterium]